MAWSDQAEAARPAMAVEELLEKALPGRCQATADYASFGQKEWQVILELGNASISGSRSSDVAGTVLQLIHAVAVRSTSHLGCQEEEELGSAVELICDYLDLILVPIVLRQLSLREEALQCACEHCSRATQVVRRLQEDSVLPVLLQIGAPDFLGRVLEEAARGAQERPSSAGSWMSVARAAEALAIFGAYARLQEGSLYSVPQGVSQALAAALQNGDCCRPAIARSLHILRNIAGNHQEVMATSANAFGTCSNQLWTELQVPDSPASSSSSSSAPAAAAPTASSPSFDTGNPQESDEFASSPEVRTCGKTGNLSKANDEKSNSRYDDRIALYSILRQAVYQSGEAEAGFITEEDLRQQMVFVARRLRTSQLPRQRLARLAFQSIRLYLLVCRSSHLRRQYAVLESAFIDEERRAVAFLLSLSPSQHCVLLRAMSQDVQSWLLWQSQALVKQNRAVTFGSTEMRQRKPPKRAKSSRSREARADGSKESQSSQKQELEGETSQAVQVVERISLFSNSEAIWMLHALLCLGLAVCLAVYWSSLEETPASMKAKAALAKNGGVRGGYLLYWR